MASPSPSPVSLIILAGDHRPLPRLEIGTHWEHKLAWPHPCPLLAQGNSSSAALTVPPNDADLSWPKTCLFYSVCLDFGNNYPVQEWELLLALYHCYSSLSKGYTLSTSLSHAWVHFSSKQQAIDVIQSLNQIYTMYVGEAKAWPDLNVNGDLIPWNHMYEEIQTLLFLQARKQHNDELVSSLEEEYSY